MLARRDVTIIRNLAAFPQQPHPFRPIGKVAELARCQRLEGALVDSGRRPRQARRVRHGIKRDAQALERGEIELWVAPLQNLHRIKIVRLDALDQVLLEGIGKAGRAECAVDRMAAGAPGDLAEFGRGQRSRLIAVELGFGGEGDVPDVEIEPHADGIGRHEKIDVSVFKQVDLGVAGAWRERPHDDGGAAALAPRPVRRWRKPRLPKRRRWRCVRAGG